MLQPQTLQINDFMKGLVSRVASDNIPDNAFADCENIDLNEKYIPKSIKGKMIVNGVPLAESMIQGGIIYKHPNFPKLERIVVACAGKLYWSDMDNNFTPFKTPAGADVQIDTVNNIEFAQYNNNLYAVNGTYPIIKNAGFEDSRILKIAETTVSGVTNAVGSPDVVPKAARYIEVHNERLFLANVQDSFTGLYWSEPYEPENFNPIYGLNYDEVGKDDGEFITGLKSLNENYIFVFKTHNVYRYLTTGSNDLWSSTRLDTGFGAVAQRTISKYNSNLVYLSQDGIAALNGNSAELIDDAIRNYTISGSSYKGIEKENSYVKNSNWFLGLNLKGINTTNNNVALIDRYFFKGSQAFNNNNYKVFDFLYNYDKYTRAGISGSDATIWGSGRVMLSATSLQTVMTTVSSAKDHPFGLRVTTAKDVDNVGKYNIDYIMLMSTARNVLGNPDLSKVKFNIYDNTSSPRKIIYSVPMDQFVIGYSYNYIPKNIDATAITGNILNLSIGIDMNGEAGSVSIDFNRPTAIGQNVGDVSDLNLGRVEGEYPIATTILFRGTEFISKEVDTKCPSFNLGKITFDVQTPTASTYNGWFLSVEYASYDEPKASWYDIDPADIVQQSFFRLADLNQRLQVDWNVNRNSKRYFRYRIIFSQKVQIYSMAFETRQVPYTYESEVLNISLSNPTAWLNFSALVSNLSDLPYIDFYIRSAANAQDVLNAQYAQVQSGQQIPTGVALYKYVQVKAVFKDISRLYGTLNSISIGFKGVEKVDTTTSGVFENRYIINIGDNEFLYHKEGYWLKRTNAQNSVYMNSHTDFYSGSLLDGTVYKQFTDNYLDKGQLYQCFFETRKFRLTDVENLFRYVKALYLTNDAIKISYKLDDEPYIDFTAEPYNKLYEIRQTLAGIVRGQTIQLKVSWTANPITQIHRLEAIWSPLRELNRR